MIKIASYNMRKALGTDRRRRPERIAAVRATTTVEGVTTVLINQRTRSRAAAGAAIAPVYDSRDLTEDPHVRETGMLLEVDDPDLVVRVAEETFLRGQVERQAA